MARSKFRFTSNERNYLDFRSEVPHRFCGNVSATDQIIAETLREKRNEANERERCIADEAKQQAERQHQMPKYRETYFSAATGSYEYHYDFRTSASRKASPKSKPVPTAKKNRKPHANRLVGVNPVRVDPWGQLMVKRIRVVQGIKVPVMSRREYDHFEWAPVASAEIDEFENRVEERLLNGHVLTMADCREMRNHGHRGNTRPHTHITGYPNEVSFLICVDGRTFHT